MTDADVAMSLQVELARYKKALELVLRMCVHGDLPCPVGKWREGSCPPEDEGCVKCLTDAALSEADKCS